MLLEQLSLMTPELCLLGFALVVVLLDLFVKQKKVVAGVAVAGVIISGGFALSIWGAPTTSIFYNMLSVDKFAVFFKFLFLAAAGLVILASQDYVGKDVELGVRIRNAVIKLEIAKKRYEYLFGGI